MRFTLADAALLAAGTTYYLFLAVFALTVLAFGIASTLGADRLNVLINDALSGMFPGLVGSSGIDAANLSSLGHSTSIIGLVVLLYSGGGAIQAAKLSIHQIYGIGKDARNYFVSRLILTGWMLVVAPLILISFAPTVLVRAFADPVLKWIDIGWFSHAGLSWLAFGVALAFNFLVLMIMLSFLGGVRPSRRSRILGAALGAVAIEGLKAVAGLIVNWSIGNPRYGAFAAPISALLMLYLQSVILYGSAAVTAAFAEQAVVIEAEPVAGTGTPEAK
jgi:membrane protein